MAAFWQDQDVCAENKPVPIPIMKPEPFISISSLPEEKFEEGKKRRVDVVTIVKKSPDSEEFSLLHHLSSHSTGTSSSYCGSCCSGGRRGSDSDCGQDDSQPMPELRDENANATCAAATSANVEMI